MSLPHCNAKLDGCFVVATRIVYDRAARLSLNVCEGCADTLLLSPFFLTVTEPLLPKVAENPVGKRTTTEVMQAGLDYFQGKVGAWGTRTFPASTPMSKARHLLREAGEVLAATAKGEEAHSWGREDSDLTENLAEECADVFLLLLHIAHAEGFSLLAAARQKFTEVQMREWAAPDATGVVEHVRKVEEAE